MNDYFVGKKLFGDDFTLEQIKRWYTEESEGYADLGSKDKNEYSYWYHEMNRIHGFSKIKNLSFENVLGIGSAWGYEFKPIIKNITNLTIIEPSDNLVSNRLGNLTPKYFKPSIDGNLLFDTNSFDLITCFGTLHHIPNVSYVLSEMIRVLRPNGYILLREPIISMGDWRKHRNGLTKNERGIPVSFFDSEFNKYPIQILSKEYCFTMTSIFQMAIGKFFKRPIYSYRFFVQFDKFLSNFLKYNVHYHPQKKIHTIAPTSVFFVIKKLLQ